MLFTLAAIVSLVLAGMYLLVMLRYGELMLQRVAAVILATLLAYPALCTLDVLPANLLAAIVAGVALLINSVIALGLGWMVLVLDLNGQTRGSRTPRGTRILHTAVVAAMAAGPILTDVKVLFLA